MAEPLTPDELQSFMRELAEYLADPAVQWVCALSSYAEAQTIEKVLKEE